MTRAYPSDQRAGEGEAKNGLKTVLMLSRFFPPMYDVGGKRAYRFARYLPEFGWRAVVLTAAAPTGDRADSSTTPLSHVHRVCRCWYPDGWPQPTRPSDGTVAEPLGRSRRRSKGLWARLQWHLALPIGREALLTPRIAWIAKRLATEERARVIFATSSPYAALLHGVAAKALSGLPLHLDLRDPWSMNFLQKTRSPWTRAGEARLEAALLQRADRVTFTSESAATAYRRAYPDIADKIGCIYNSFDPAQQPCTSTPLQGPITLVHFGNCYGARRLETVLRAVAVLRDEGAIEAGDLVVRNLGRMVESDLRLIHQLGIGRYVQFRPFVPYEEGLRSLASADLQLLLAYGNERLYVPAKLFDYLLSGAPILCVAPPSELTEIVARTKAGHSVAPGDVATTVRLIRETMDARALGQRRTRLDDTRIGAFSARRTAELLARSLDELSEVAR